jgi:TPR repeat protein
MPQQAFRIVPIGLGSWGMPTSEDTIKAAAPGTAGARDRLKGLAFKVGKVDPEHSNAAWDAPPKPGPPKPPSSESGPPEFKTEGASAPARTRNARQRRLRWVDLALMVLAASASVKLALAQERDRTKELEGQLVACQSEQALRLALAQERDRTKELEGQLAARLSEQALALAQERDRAEERLAALQREQALTLAQARAFSQTLERELATRTGAKLAVTSNVPAPPAGVERVATPAPVAVSAAEVARVMARAERLLAQGDVGAARSLLERAAEAGSPLATFRLAECYDPTVLSTWGTVGTQGDAAKAQELYAKAAAGGVEAERRDRPR